jgi:histidinol-phosphate aminotransferase
MPDKTTPIAQRHLASIHRTNMDGQIRKGYLRLDMNEAVPGLPEDFVKRVSAEIDGELLASYPNYQELQQQLAAHNQLGPENILLSNGSDGGIKYIFDAYVAPGQKILLTDPTFAMYPVYCRLSEAEPIIVEYRSDMSFPMQEFIANISPAIKMAVVVNPNNPTGTALSQDDLITIITKAAKYNVLVVVDEAYFYFYPKSIIKQIQYYPNLIILRTFSKLLGIAGVRLGYIAASPEIVSNLRKVRPTFDVNAIAVLFAQRLLEAPEIIAALTKAADAGKEYLLQKLTEAGIPHCPGMANFILIQCNGRVTEIVQKLAEKGILVGSGFKNDFLRDYIRVTVGAPQIMEKFWQSFMAIWR